MGSKKDITRAILRAGLLAGTLDITAALIYFFIKGGREPLSLFRYIATGVFGKTAFTGSWLMGVWGLFLHYIIAYLFTIFFFLLYPAIHKVIKIRAVAGLLYGAFVWMVMNLLIVPMSNVPKAPLNVESAIINAVILVLMVGLPLAFMAHKHYYGHETSIKNQ